MASFHSVLVTFLFLTVFNVSNGAFSEDTSDTIKIMRMEKTTHLHFYFHDILDGKNPSAVKITGPGIVGVGTTYIINDLLTQGPNITSKFIGKAQGLYTITSVNEEIALLMVVCYEFTEGKYNGSSISVIGRNPVMHDVREMPIMGGTGLFRLARGYVLAHTVWSDSKTGDATVEYNVHVQHF